MALLAQKYYRARESVDFSLWILLLLNARLLEILETSMFLLLSEIRELILRFKRMGGGSASKIHRSFDKSLDHTRDLTVFRSKSHDHDEIEKGKDDIADNDVKVVYVRECPLYSVF